MNRVVVGAGGGRARHLPARSGLAGGRVIIGFDARHSSDVFARDTAEIMAGAGFEALLAAVPLPTPRRRLRHPPLSVRGRSRGHRLAQPAAGQRLQGLPGRRVADRAARPTPTSPSGSWRSPSTRLADVPRSDGYRLLGAELSTRTSRGSPPWCRRGAPRACAGSTPRCTGWAGDRVRRRRTGPVSARPSVGGRAGSEPDPDFPTRAFPNPEEPGAIDLALAQARTVGADLVVANDPDADRCAVARADRRPLADAARRRAGRAARRRCAAPRGRGVPTPARSCRARCLSRHGRPRTASRSSTR